MFSKDKKTIKRILAIVMCVCLVAVSLAGCMPAAPTGDGTTGDGTAADGTAANGTAGGGMFGIGTIVIYFLVIILVFYFFMIRPEKKRKKKTEEMRNSLAVGNNITTIGGMTGKIVNISGDFVTFETGEDRVRIKIAKWGISSVGKDAEEPDEKANG